MLDEWTLHACRFRDVTYAPQRCQLHNWRCRIQAARTEFSLGVWATEDKAAWAFDQAAIALGVSSAHDTTPQLGSLDNDSSLLRAAFNHSDLQLHQYRPDFNPR